MAAQSRPPVITIMGHVDHGKTSLLDYIRKTRVAAGEAGGITQHIGAYQIEANGKKLTFIDTPGHAAFNKMRERGSKITDVIILVVAANDGVKPQTIESIRHIKNSKASFVVAINKTDLQDIRLDEVRAQLAEHGLVVREFGGDVDAVNISAKTGKGIDDLLENIVVMSDLLELKADPEAPLEAVVIESTLDSKKGVTASVIVQQGTLAVRQDLVTENADGQEIVGRVRALMDENSKQLKVVTPGSPAEIIGLKGVPPVGAVIRDATRDYAELEELRALEAEEAAAEEQDDENPFADLDFDAAFGEKEKLKLIIRSDVEGTLEVIHQNLDEDQVEVLSSGVGIVTENDIEMATTSGATIIAFHTKVPGKMKQLAKDRGVKIKSYDVIYKLIEDLQKQILKLIEPGIDEVVTGEAEILQIFEMKGDRIAGVRVKTGEIKKNDLLHLKRGEEMVFEDPKIKSMMHGKDEIDVIKSKNEGGITFRRLAKGKTVPFEVGDMIVAYTVDEE
jgi:translation initiation factor IF-2